MDIAQIEQMVTWLDQQRRQADQERRQLEQRMASQMGLMEDQARRIQQLEGELAATRAQLAQHASLQESLDNLRTEVRLMVERLEEERLARERDQERLRAAEREKLGRDLATLRREFERVKAVEEGLQMRQVEERRLGEGFMQLRQAVVDMDRRLEERARAVTLLTEQRSQDHKRIAQLQQETVELFKRLETTIRKLTLLEERFQRQETSVKDLVAMTEGLREEQQTFLEEVRQAELGRQQTMRQWEEAFAQMSEHMDNVLKRLDMFHGQYERAVRAVAEIERWQAELRRDVNEAREAQRIGEQRAQTHMREFEEEQEKRWKKQMLEWDYRWQEQNRRIDGLQDRLTPMAEQLSVQQDLLEQLWHLQEEYGSHRLAGAQRLFELIEAALQARERTLKAKGPGQEKAKA